MHPEVARCFVPDLQHTYLDADLLVVLLVYKLNMNSGYGGCNCNCRWYGVLLCREANLNIQQPTQAHLFADRQVACTHAMQQTRNSCMCSGWLDCFRVNEANTPARQCLWNQLGLKALILFFAESCLQTTLPLSQSAPRCGMRGETTALPA
jgi:hypothetical protein